jgi:predicted RNase H-like HicB family nuclease
MASRLFVLRYLLSTDYTDSHRLGRMSRLRPSPEGQNLWIDYNRAVMYYARQYKIVGRGDVVVKKPLFVRVEWDEDASVWVATSDDVPGLATEEKDMELLIEKLRVMIPELLEANGIEQDAEIPFEIITRRFETIQPVNY